MKVVLCFAMNLMEMSPSTDSAELIKLKTKSNKGLNILLVVLILSLMSGEMLTSTLAGFLFSHSQFLE